MFKVETGVEIPVHSNTRQTWPFTHMKKGDSFFAPGYHTSVSRTKQFGGKLFPSALVHRKKFKDENAKFVVRAWEEDGVMGIRIWRTE